MILRLAVWTALLLGFAVVAESRGDDAGDRASRSKAAKLNAEQNKKIQKLTAEQEEQALGFARSQHPELAELLERLKKNDRKEYARAMLDLHRARNRVERFAEKQPERFALELALWKVDSRIRLLAAQMVISRDEGVDAELKPLLAERRHLKLQLVQLERAKLVERSAQLDRQLAELQTDPESRDEQELAKLKENVVKRQKAPVKPSRKKAKVNTPKGAAPKEEGASQSAPDASE